MIFKVHIFWEGHKILQNLPPTFDYSTYSQGKGKILHNFVAFSEYMNFKFLNIRCIRQPLILRCEVCPTFSGWLILSKTSDKIESFSNWFWVNFVKTENLFYSRLGCSQNYPYHYLIIYKFTYWGWRSGFIWTALLNDMPRFLENSFLALNSVLNKRNVLFVAQINKI